MWVRVRNANKVELHDACDLTRTPAPLTAATAAAARMSPNVRIVPVFTRRFVRFFEYEFSIFVRSGTSLKPLIGFGYVLVCGRGGDRGVLHVIFAIVAVKGIFECE